MTDWTIRRAEAGDAEALAACIDAAYAPYAERISDLPPVSANCAREIAHALVWVAERDGRIVGGLVLIPRDGYLQFANVAVHPDQQGTGLGRAFMELAEREAVSRRYSEMRLNTHADMTGNIRLYSRLGWRQTGRSGNTVSMSKAL